MNQESTPIPNGENTKPKEFLADNLAVSLHTRLILGGPTLDPNKTDIPETTAEQLKSEHQKTREDTLNKLSAASTVTRIEHWAKQEGTFDDHMKKWVIDIKSAYKNPSVNSAVLADTFTRLSLGDGNDRIVLSNLDDANAQKLFQRYFAENSFQVTVKRENGDFVTIPSNVKKFIEDVAATYNTRMGTTRMGTVLK